MSDSNDQRIKQVAAIFSALIITAATIAILETNHAFGQAIPSQGSSNGTNTSSTSGQSSNGTLSTTLQSCIANQNATTGTAANQTQMSNDTTTSASNTTSAAAANMNKSSNTANTTSSGANVTAIAEATGNARLHLIEACNAVQSQNSELAIQHLNLVAKALDDITGNLTSDTTAAGSTNSSSVSNSTSGQTSSTGNSTNPLDQLGKMLGLK